MSSGSVGGQRAVVETAFGLYTTVPVQIQPYPEFRARAGAPGQYQSPPEDGSRPPIHLLNTWDPTHKSRAGVESTTLHETWPGHHQQTMVARKASAQHRLVRSLFNSGFGEGWALYAERVADEMGLYSGELDRFGYLASAKFRSARMVVDAGIHTRNMSYDDAICWSPRVATGQPALAKRLPIRRRSLTSMALLIPRTCIELIVLRISRCPADRTDGSAQS